MHNSVNVLNATLRAHVKMVKEVNVMYSLQKRNKRQENIKTCAKFFSHMPLSLPTKPIPSL